MEKKECIVEMEIRKPLRIITNQHWWRKTLYSYSIKSIDLFKQRLSTEKKKQDKITKHREHQEKVSNIIPHRFLYWSLKDQRKYKKAL